MKASQSNFLSSLVETSALLFYFYQNYYKSSFCPFLFSWITLKGNLISPSALSAMAQRCLKLHWFQVQRLRLCSIFFPELPVKAAALRGIPGWSTSSGCMSLGSVNEHQAADVLHRKITVSLRIHPKVMF